MKKYNIKGKKVFEILQTPNFYFPVIDKGKKFIILDTMEFKLENYYFEVEKLFKSMKSIDFRIYSEPIWKEINKFIDNKYKNCWFVPLKIDFYENEIIATVDILQLVDEENLKNEKITKK